MNSGEVDPAPCARCNGSGLRDPGPDDLESQYAPCPTCHGYGYRSRGGGRRLPVIARSVVLAGAFAMAVLTVIVLASR
jgi:hypothetical protein